MVRLGLESTKLPEGVYLATSEEVQGLLAQGRTIQETLEIARDVAKKLIEARHEVSHHDRSPLSVQTQTPLDNTGLTLKTSVVLSHTRRPPSLARNVSAGRCIGNETIIE